jgi:hypothetical protein
MSMPLSSARMAEYKAWSSAFCRTPEGVGSLNSGWTAVAKIVYRARTARSTLPKRLDVLGHWHGRRTLERGAIRRKFDFLRMPATRGLLADLAQPKTGRSGDRTSFLTRSLSVGGRLDLGFHSEESRSAA